MNNRIVNPISDSMLESILSLGYKKVTPDAQVVFDPYYDKMNELGIKIGFEPKVYYYMIKLCGVRLSTAIMNLPRKLYRRKRMNAI